jgi:chromosome segregation ATPase
MNSRVLPVLNLVGCLALTGLVLVQWRKEHVTDAATAALRNELNSARAEIAEAAKQRAALERDIVVLKESIEATQKSAETSARGLEEKERQVAELETGIATARGQVTAWEAAIQQRDERIRTLEGDLAKTRQRLDEAVARIKEAAAR